MSDELVVVTVTYSPGPHLDRFLATMAHATEHPVTVVMADNVTEALPNDDAVVAVNTPTPVPVLVRSRPATATLVWPSSVTATVMLELPNNAHGLAAHDLDQIFHRSPLRLSGVAALVAWW